MTDNHLSFTFKVILVSDNRPADAEEKNDFSSPLDVVFGFSVVKYKLNNHLMLFWALKIEREKHQIQFGSNLYTSKA